MKAVRIVLLSCVSLLPIAEPAYACRIYQRFDPSFVRHAQVVLVGRILDYAVVQGRNISGDVVQLHARFNVKIEKVLQGQAPEVRTVTWYNSTFQFPETMPEGPYVIALQKDLYKPEALELTVLQQNCSSAFILDAASEEAATVRRLAIEGAGP